MASQNMLETYTRLMTDSRIKVRVEGWKACATKEEVVIPALPADNERAMIYGTGYAMHEGGHILDSDFDAWPKFPPLANLANIFEDVRIEAKQMVRYSGARRRLSDLFENLVSDGYFEQPTEKDGTAARITGFLLYRMRATLLGQRAFEQYAQVAEKLCDESVPKNAMVRLKVMMYRITEATCTADSIALAEAVLDMLKEEQEKAEEEAQQQQQPPQQPPQAQSNDPSGAGQSPSADPQGNGEEEENQNSGDPSQSNANQGTSDPSQGNGEEDDAAQGQGSSSNATDPEEPASQTATSGKEDASNQQKAENLRRFTSGEDNEGVGDLGKALETALNQISKEAGMSAVAIPRIGKMNETIGNAAAIADRVLEATRALKRRVLNLLEGIDRDKRINTTSGQRLDMTKLHRTATGSIRVFQKRIEGQKMNTAVQVLIDRSYSMNQEKRLETAVDAAMAMGFTLEHVKSMKSSIAAFPYVVDQDSHGVGILSEFGERLAQVTGKFAAVRPCGFTPMAEALLGCGLRLSSRKEERKILFVLTDGMPEDGIHPESICIANTKQILKQLEQAGIEVMAIGINIDVSSIFSESENIDEVKNLPNAVFRMLQSKLLHKKAA